MLLKQNERGENLERSMSMDANTFSHTDVKTLQEIIKKLDEEIEDKSNQIYELQKEKYIQENTIKDREGEIDKILKMKMQSEERATLLQK